MNEKPSEQPKEEKKSGPPQRPLLVASPISKRGIGGALRPGLEKAAPPAEEDKSTEPAPEAKSPANPVGETALDGSIEVIPTSGEEAVVPGIPLEGAADAAGTTPAIVPPKALGAEDTRPGDLL